MVKFYFSKPGRVLSSTKTSPHVLLNEGQSGDQCLKCNRDLKLSTRLLIQVHDHYYIITFDFFTKGEKGSRGDKGSQGEKGSQGQEGLPGKCDTKVIIALEDFPVFILCYPS